MDDGYSSAKRRVQRDATGNPDVFKTPEGAVRADIDDLKDPEEYFDRDRDDLGRKLLNFSVWFTDKRICVLGSPIDSLCCLGQVVDGDEQADVVLFHDVLSRTPPHEVNRLLGIAKEKLRPSGKVVLVEYILQHGSASAMQSQLKFAGFKNVQFWRQVDAFGVITARNP